MITFIAFILAIIGCINWLSIGLLQYDFIAGFFGFQASIFSRLIYILFGIGAVYLVIRAIANKGSFKIYEKRNKKQKNQQPAPAYANVEATKENLPKKSYDKKGTNDTILNENHQENEFEKHWPDDDSNQKTSQQKEDENLFDEHFKNNI